MLVSLARALHKLDDALYVGVARMAEIDIDGLSEAELVALSDRIAERLRILHQRRTSAALRSLKIGSRVMFEGPGGTLISGIITRHNRKTVTVHTDNDRRWNVSPELIMVTDDDVSALVEREMPFLKVSDEDYKAWVTANVLPFVKK